MGRPKLYADRGEQMRAYRARKAAGTVPVERRSYEWLLNALEELRGAVSSAAAAGDKLASEIETVSCEDVLIGLRLHFRVRAEVLRDEQLQVAVPPVAAAGNVDRAVQRPFKQPRVLKHRRPSK